MCLCIVDGVYLRLVWQSPLILEKKGNDTSFLAVQTTGTHDKAVNCRHLSCK